MDKWEIQAVADGHIVIASNPLKFWSPLSAMLKAENYRAFGRTVAFSEFNISL